MEVHVGTVSLARALMALDRTRQSGVLQVIGDAGRCRVTVIKGTPRAAGAVPGAEASLGDTLLRSGDLDTEAHRRAMERGNAARPVGRWLVQIGATTRPAVEHALRAQLRARLLEVLLWTGLRYHFIAGEVDTSLTRIAEPVATADVVLGAMRQATAKLPLDPLNERLGAGRLQLNRLGRYLLARAALWPEEAATAALLRDGSRLQSIIEITSGSARAYRLLYALDLLGAITANPSEGLPCSLLVSKRLQLRRQAGDSVLLDLPRDARPEQARRALRKMARRLHPDRLGQNAPRALRQASTEVMRALSRAESSIREQRNGSGRTSSRSRG